MIYVETWKKVFIIFLTALTLTSCQGKLNHAETIVDLSDDIGRERAAFVEDLSDNLQIVVINEDSIMIGANSHIRLVNPSGIYIENKGTLYRYSSDGNILNSIGVNGQGPGEYPYPGTVGFINPDRLVLINSGRMQYFDTLGSFVKEIPLPNGINGARIFNDSMLIAYSRDFDAEHIDEKIPWLTLSGIEQASQKIYSDNISVDMVIMGWPSLDYVNGRFVFRDEWSTDIYSVGDNEISHMLSLDFGRRNPSREYYQDGNFLERANTEIISIQQFISNGDLAFLTVLYEQKLQQIIIKISSQEVLYSKVYTEKPDCPFGIGFRNISMFKFWPEYVSSTGDFYALIDTAYLSEDELSALRKIRGCEFISEDSHVILRICDGKVFTQ